VKQQIRIKELEAAIKEQKANIQAARVASGSDGRGRGRYSSDATKQINQWKVGGFAGCANPREET